MLHGYWYMHAHLHLECIAQQKYFLEVFVAYRLIFWFFIWGIPHKMLLRWLGISNLQLKVRKSRESGKTRNSILDLFLGLVCCIEFPSWSYQLGDDCGAGVGVVLGWAHSISKRVVKSDCMVVPYMASQTPLWHTSQGIVTGFLCIFWNIFVCICLMYVLRFL